MRTDVLDLAAIRTQHTLLLLTVLWHQDVTRIELSRRLGLSRSAVSSIVSELIDANVVREVGKHEGRRQAGRKATLLTLNTRCAHLLSVDLGARHLRVALLDLGCKVLEWCEVAHDVSCGPRETYRVIKRLVEQVLERAGVELPQVVMIGVGIPGPVDHHTGCIVHPPNMPGWDGENVSAALRELYGLPVLVDNDANLGALAEWRFGERRGVADLVYLKTSTGIGAGILLSGRLYRGARGGAGEIGHISINEMGPRGRSGNPGSLESYAASDIVLATMRERLVRAPRSSAPQSGSLESSATESTALHPESTLNDMLRLAQDDPLARELWQETGRHLGVAITTVLNLFNPAAVVIGGQMALAGPPLLDAILEVVNQRALIISREGVHVSLSVLGAEVGVLGAGAMLLEELFTAQGLPQLYRVAALSGARGHPSRAPPGHGISVSGKSKLNSLSVPGGII